MTNLPLERLMVFTGNANARLAQDVVKHLNIGLGRAIVGRFSDGEVLIELLENVRGKDVFILQSTCAPTNDNLMELLVMVDALKRSSAARVTAAIPYFGYARQDRRPRSARVAISAKVVANMLTSVGVARVLTMDLHADQIQGFFDMPVDNIYAAPVLLGDVWKQHYDDLIAEVMNVIGDVEGRTCVIMDDMVDTAGTLCKAAQVLKEEGATRVVAYCTHPVLSGGAVERIAASDLDELVVTDTIPLREEAHACSRIRQLSVAGLLAETILRIFTEESVSSLFTE
jgi:ribose-phosphate pyrophosphokinase